MKTTITLKLILFIFILTIVFNSCEKGETVVPEKDGNTIVSSYNYTLPSWKYSSPYYYANLSVPALTAENINTSGVLLYFSVTGDKWYGLPYTQYTSSSNYFMGFNTTIGNVQITWVYNNSLSSGDDPNTYYSTKVLYKVVVIPSSAKSLKQNINYKDYNEVKAAFNLKD